MIQVAEFLFAELKHEVGGKTIEIPLHGLNQGARFHIVEFSQIRTQNGPLATQEENALFNLPIQHNWRISLQL